MAVVVMPLPERRPGRMVDEVPQPPFAKIEHCRFDGEPARVADGDFGDRRRCPCAGLYCATFALH